MIVRSTRNVSTVNNVNNLLDELRHSQHNPYPSHSSSNLGHPSTSQSTPTVALAALIDGAEHVPELPRVRRTAGPQAPLSWQIRRPRPGVTIPPPQQAEESFDTSTSIDNPPDEISLRQLFSLALPSLAGSSPTILSLQSICIHSVVTSLAPGHYFHQLIQEDPEYIPSLPPHLRRRIVQDAALSGTPFSASILKMLWDSELGVDGEAILVGRSLTSADYEILGLARQLLHPHNLDGSSSVGDEVSTDTNDSWDDDTESTPLRMFILSSLPSPSLQLLSSLPRTLTHLALINLTSAVFHQTLSLLSRILPLLIVLDLSSTTSPPPFRWIDLFRIVKWNNRWSSLERIGLRNCRQERNTALSASERKGIVDIVNSKRVGKQVEVIFDFVDIA